MASPGPCSVCHVRPAVNPGKGVTCGDSYCQEAAYRRNVADVARGRKRTQLFEAAAVAMAAACENARRRSARRA